MHVPKVQGFLSSFQSLTEDASSAEYNISAVLNNLSGELWCCYTVQACTPLVCHACCASIIDQCLHTLEHRSLLLALQAVHSPTE
jgi:hypothetical protein